MSDFERPDEIGQPFQRFDGFFEHLQSPHEPGVVHRGPPAAPPR
jgi:hypothetical protein